ncbi:MAG: anthranilate phosphoribosyltransferase [Candidatus Omnitrophica bacterium]|nr:anthranilate phosphoribosyltransferase [Candidatus Omnitrophota bacterium]
MNNFREVIQKVSRGEKLSKDLTREEARQALEWIFEGQASQFQIGALFAALRMKGESAEETAGFVEVVRKRAKQLHSKLGDSLDIGDPYDGKVRSLHLTVPVALILAAAGVPVILHSTPETPVKKGVETQRVLEALGIQVVEDTDRLTEILEEEKIVFLPTEKLVPDFARLRPFREEFGLRPFTNHIEKIFNLAHAETQMVGIYHKPYLEPMGEALSLLGTHRIFVIQGVEGFTELFLSRKTLVFQIEQEERKSYFLEPAQYGFHGEEESMQGKGILEHAKRIHELLKRSTGPGRDLILWNAGVKLFWMKKASSIEEGIEWAKEILDSEKAYHKLEAFRNATQEKASSKKI